MGLFDRVTPDGYPQGGDAYADSNALLQRWHFMEDIAGAAQPPRAEILAHAARRRRARRQRPQPAAAGHRGRRRNASSISPPCA